MKKLALMLSAATTLGGISLTAQAQYGYDSDVKPDRRYYLSPMATYSLYDSSRGFEDEVGYHLSIGKILGRGTNIELHGTFAAPEAEAAAGTAGELTSYGVSFLLFQWRDSLPMYGILSIAKGFAESESGGALKPTSDQFDVGLGYMLELGNWPLVGRGPALRFEARYRLDKFDQSEANDYASVFGTSNDRSYHDGVFGVGLYVPLGADPNRKEEPDEPEVVAQIVVAAQDSDGDQIPDDMDACPDTPPGASIDARGCERDSDGDGIVNSQDQCPDSEPGVVVASNGCPPDDDADGVANIADLCPATPAGKSVLADGCAISGDCRIPAAGQRIDQRGCAVGAVTLKGVRFSSGSETLTNEATKVLDEVAQALQGSLSVRIEVGGHTDSQGPASANLRLSQRRADAVKAYLEANGVAAGILSSRGYGESEPIADNTTAAGRDLNRRVELKVLQP